MTEGEGHVTGTVRLLYVDSLNKGRLEEAVHLLGKQERGSWMVLQVLELHPNHDELKK